MCVCVCVTESRGQWWWWCLYWGCDFFVSFFCILIFIDDVRSVLQCNAKTLYTISSQRGHVISLPVTIRDNVLILLGIIVGRCLVGRPAMVRMVRCKVSETEMVLCDVQQYCTQSTLIIIYGFRHATEAMAISFSSSCNYILVCGAVGAQLF